MPLGGSITQGVGSSERNGYRQYLYEALLLGGFKVRMVGSRRMGSFENNSHEGWRGFRIDEIEKKARQSVKRFLPNVITVNAGSNDCLQDFDIEHIGERMGNMLEYLWQVSPRSTVVLSTLLVNLDKEVDSRVIRVNEQFRVLARQKAADQKRITLADMYVPGGPQIGDLVDGTHPSEEGYQKMTKIWYNAIQEAARNGLLQEPEST
ncbi:hypothetical protein DL765_006490 [Monosporascus sp. GIB2]|nr:hypothetical protein DL765_006490 [Monosporascus sp. GIB2]